MMHNKRELDFNNILIKPSVTTYKSRADVNLVRSIYPKYGHPLTGIPIISANMDKVSTVEAANILGQNDMFCALHKFCTDEELKNIQYKDKVFLTFGITDIDNIKAKLDVAGIDYDRANLCLDVANGGMVDFFRFIREVRDEFVNSTIMAGNCVTQDVAEEIVHNGADFVKVGIGSGKYCKTRSVAGVGRPQFSAVKDVSEVYSTVSDGGIREICDVSKAFVAGAEMVMIGTMFAGHFENMSEDEKQSFYAHYLSYVKQGYTGSYEDFKQEPKDDFHVEMYGMSSNRAMRKHYGGMENYKTSEGHHSNLDYKGSLQHTINDILGGLRSACTYTDSSNTEELSFCDFYEVA